MKSHGSSEESTMQYKNAVKSVAVFDVAICSDPIKRRDSRGRLDAGTNAALVDVSIPCMRVHRSIF